MRSNAIDNAECGWFDAVRPRTLGEEPSVDSRRRNSRRSGAGAIVSTSETAEILPDPKRAGL